MNRSTENKKQVTPAGKPRWAFFERTFPGFVCTLLVGLTLGMALLGASQKRESSAEKTALRISRQKAFETQQQNIALQKQALDTQAQAIDTQNRNIERLEGVLSYALGQDYSGQPFKTRTVHATAYTARAEECNSEPWVTASGTPSRVGVIAVSRDIEKIGIRLGDLVIIKGMGLFRVEDRMNKRWKNRIDILHANLEAARRFAKREVEIMWVGRPQIASRESTPLAPLG